FGGGDQCGGGEAVGGIALGDRGDGGQMTVDELVHRLEVAVLAPALRKHVLFVRFQHRDPPDFLNIAGEAGFGRYALIRGYQPSHESPSTTFETQLSASAPIVNLISKHYYLA